MDTSNFTLWTGPFPVEGLSCFFFLFFFELLLPCSKEISAFNANSVDPDQTLRAVASDLSLHCLGGWGGVEGGGGSD